MPRNDASIMDPQQTAVYAKAHGELRDLFEEIARHGRVTFVELQNALLPFTAGDAKRDLQELVDDMKRKQTSLDEADFIRVMWKKMYLSNVLFTAKQTGTKSRPSSASAHRGSLAEEEDGSAFNIPLAHVIVSIKRRAQLKQFANYYTSRGISGADHLNADTGSSASERNTPRHLVRSQKKRQAAATAAAQAATISALRGRKSTAYDMLVYCFDADMLSMRIHNLLAGVEAPTVSNCTRLYCLVSTKGTGGFIIGSEFFINRTRKRAQQIHLSGSNQDSGDRNREHERLNNGSAKSALPAPKDLNVEKLEDLGLRNIAVFGVGRGTVVAATERRVHCWNAFAHPTVPPVEPAVDSHPSTERSESGSVNSSVLSDELVEFLEDEGDCFGQVPLMKRAKMASDVPCIRQIACGDRFVIGLTASSELYGWGTAPLGRGKASPAKLPLFVAEPIVITRIGCGLTHVLSLTDQGRVFAWGSNVHGQLGVLPQGSALDGFVDEPVEVKLPSVILDLVCGDRHSVVLTNKGNIFSWGNNWDGQLGLDPSSTDIGNVFAPTKVSWWLNVDGGPHETTRVGDDLLDEDSSSSPQKGSGPSSPRVYLISAIGDTTAIVSDDGGVYVWGKCVPPGRFAGACGIVSKWRAQRVEVELPESHGLGDIRAPATTTSPWAGIAIANGLVLLSRHGGSF